MVRPTLWLPPKVWFQGNQSTNTGGASVSKGMDWHICCWLAHHMRWVLITPLGNLVEPEVNKNFTTVSGPVACMAASTAGVAVVAIKSAKAVLGRSLKLPWCSTISTSAATVALMALP